MTSIVREARLADARAIAVVHVDVWRSTYRGLIADEFLATLSYEAREKVWQRNLTDGQLGFTLVAEDGEGAIVGFASGGPERTKDPDHRGELYAIYVLDSAQGRGLGRRLTVDVVSRLAEGGMSSLLVWVLAANPARRFYERLGGGEVKRKLADIGGKSYEEIGFGWKDTERLRRDARPPPA